MGISPDRRYHQYRPLRDCPDLLDCPDYLHHLLRRQYLRGHQRRYSPDFPDFPDCLLRPEMYSL